MKIIKFLSKKVVFCFLFLHSKVFMKFPPYKFLIGGIIERIEKSLRM